MTKEQLPFGSHSLGIWFCDCRAS